MSLGMILIPLADSAGKSMVAGGVAPTFVAWSRFILGALVLLPFIKDPGAVLAALRDWRIWLRGFLVVGGITSMQMALRSEPLANTYGAFFVGPIISYGLSVFFLGEPGNRVQVSLLCVGFLGVLLVVQPNTAISPGILYAVLAGICYGAYLTASRWLADRAPPKVLLMSQMLIGSLVLLVPGSANTPQMSLGICGEMLISGLASMAGNLLLVMAYRNAPASLLAPFAYIQLLGATCFGWLFFDDLPNLLAMIGLTLIVGSGFASLLVRQRPPPPSRADRRG